ncbi:MAG: GPR endopeptidase [Clostridiales bacterium]|nr:GPR endopeptidase [Clostridiales bacterium]
MKKYYNFKRTDLALEYAERLKTEENPEGIIAKSYIYESCKVSHIKIDKQGESLYNKSAGNYYTIFCKGEKTNETKALTKCLSESLPKGKVLVTGLGNRAITPDALGIKTAAKVLATAQFKQLKDFEKLNLREVYVLMPNVLSQTGIESTNQIKAICREIGADFVIAIDALACSDINRLTSTIQFTDTGISPGSGVGNMRKALSKDTLGIPCYAIGVPMVIDLDSLCNGNENSQLLSRNMMVTPRNIDAVVNNYSDIISDAINKSLNPSLEKDEIEQLLMY